MKPDHNSIRVSATDVSNHLACNHLTTLDLAVATGAIAAPAWRSPDAWVLQQRGLAHENAYIDHLRSQRLAIANFRDIGNEKEACSEAIAAMQSGVDVIVQPALVKDHWFGRADVLRKVEGRSAFGDWSYEVVDCKLAVETKSGTILQLSLYSELLAEIQRAAPEFMHVIAPNDRFEPETFRLSDFSAYHRYVKRRLESAIRVNGNGHSTYPEPTEHCAVCRWWHECDHRRRADDHLSLVAGISNLQRKQLQAWDVTTVQKLAVLPVPLERRPERGSKNAYMRVREQARIQAAGRTERRPVYEVLDMNPEHGFRNLPAPVTGDVFFDLEGDPFAHRGGQEYLFGVAIDNGGGQITYECRWGLTAADEKAAFEWFVDLVIALWAQHPAMHIYHFTSYEPSALKRLMGRYATREAEIDRMLRARLFVDLHTILKRSVRASVETYSLKEMEAFHGFQRNVPLDIARTAMHQLQHGLELGEVMQIGASVREIVAQYNADDCVSTLFLRNWLENERAACERAGHPIPRPEVADGAPPERVDERQQRIAVLAGRLRLNSPEDPALRTPEQAAAWLLSDLLDWHRRELKADWWEFYRLGELSDEDLLDERSALGGLHFIKRLGVHRNIPMDRYGFAKQETDIRAGDELWAMRQKIGEVIAIDIAARTVDIKKTKKTADVHPAAVYVKDVGPDTEVLADALFRIGSWVAANGVDEPGPYRAARDLLLRRPPRLAEPAALLVNPGEAVASAATRLAILLNSSVLAIQGPPGAGKTFTGARMICELVRQGKRVGITATSHKVIGNLLKEVVATAGEIGLDRLNCVQKVKREEKPEHNPPHILTTTDNPETWAAFFAGADVLAGTQWLWTQEDYFEAVDVLFVDEAGQMSLANVIAVAQAAKNIVLLGDPQQLEQPLRGSHPDGADVSALEHLLGGAKTIASDRGLFLDKTWRLHPRLCQFTSEAFYEGRLNSREGLQFQRIEGHPWLGEAGLWFVPVVHDGNQNSSPEEVEVVADLVRQLTEPEVRWADDRGRSRALSLDDILIVAPYNAQVFDLTERIRNGRIGTVDRFQGQQAPVVIYSLTTSSPEDAPRGMEFLYSLNRMNVATSRAQAVVILVGSPRLLEPDCHTPRQMQLANALCRYVELAKTAGRDMAAGR